jgi:predicted transcriptional regulator
MIKEEKESSLRSVVRNLIENRISANVEDAVINCCRVFRLMAKKKQLINYAGEVLSFLEVI